MSIGPFDSVAADAGISARLQQRLEQFSRAMAAGGAREAYLDWQASRAALAAALEIVGQAATPGRQAAREQLITTE